MAVNRLLMTHTCWIRFIHGCHRRWCWALAALPLRQWCNDGCNEVGFDVLVALGAPMLISRWWPLIGYRWDNWIVSAIDSAGVTPWRSRLFDTAAFFHRFPTIFLPFSHHFFVVVVVVVVDVVDVVVYISHSAAVFPPFLSWSWILPWRVSDAFRTPF